ncbi:FimV family protein, partial [Candidatus Magnetaquicoccus inordinatus]|uniref:type IV pilus assembly protein FimV n=1 Tax=Candidatus Magnetaquicoccus inordinatus TaxID=2496818 RepID=UPI00187D3817
MATRLHFLLFCCSALLLLVFPHDVAAFALGELKLQSKWGQPLQGVASLTLDPGEEIVSVDMGSNSDYLTLNLPRKPVVTQITAQLSEQNGGLFVSVHSANPIRESDFYIVLRISSNQHTYFPFLRIRPPVGEKQSSAAPEKASTTVVRQEQRTVEGAPAVASPPSSAPAKEGQEKNYGPVRAKEGLRDVARRFVKGTPFTVQQIEVAIWRRNANLFTRNNMNGLKAGVKLVIPSHEEIARISKKEAKEIRISQAAEWKKGAKERNQAAAPAQPPVVEKGSDSKAQIAAPAAAAQEKVTLPVMGEPPPATSATPRPTGKESNAAKGVEKAAEKPAAPTQEGQVREGSKEADKEQVKVESGTLKAILVQLQTITRVLENQIANMVMLHLTSGWPKSVCIVCFCMP